MIDDSKHIRSDVDGVRDSRGKSERNSTAKRKKRFSVYSELLIPIGSGVLQITVGLALVAVSILGLIAPLWLAAFLSLAGSVSTMAGVFLIYYIISSKGTFDSLINQAIRRVISAQN
jgi:ABC-type multidrug transport system fused ATPase/permease subunit